MEHRAVRRQDKAVTDTKWMEDILKRGRVLHLGLAGGDGWPYVVTMNYGYKDGVLYVHGAAAGRKIEMLAANPKVCFQVALDIDLALGETAPKFTMKYRSVTGFGRLTPLTDPDARRKGLNILMDQVGGPHVGVEDVSEMVWVARIDVEYMTGKKSVYAD